MQHFFVKFLHFLFYLILSFKLLFFLPRTYQRAYLYPLPLCRERDEHEHEIIDNYKTRCQLAEGPVPRSDSEIPRCLAQEAEKILSLIQRTDTVIPLCIEGKSQNSESFAAKLGKLRDEGAQRIVFVIGSSHGLDPSVVARANQTLSMSEMTFPHQLARVMFLEQLYRAFTILNNQTYHK